MKKFLKNISKEKIFFILFVLIFGIIFFSYNIVLTWDSSEYLRMAKILGTKEMTSNWIGHRGMSFPLLLKVFQLFNNKYMMLVMLYVFYIVMLIVIMKILNKLKKIDFFVGKPMYIISLVWIFVFVILNPIIFGYYHTILTEFVSMTVTVVICYLSFNWLEFKWENDKKKIIKYAIIFSILAVFMYHVKQSLIPIILVAILITSLLSVIENWNLKNILVRVLTLVFVLGMVLISIFIWNNAMVKSNVKEETSEKRIKNKVVFGIRKIWEVCDEQRIEDFDLEGIDMSEKDKEEIKKVMSNTSKYKRFKIYKNKKDKYFVYFTKDNYSFTEQIGFHLKILYMSPSDVIQSYYASYYDIIFIMNEYPIEYFKENYNIPMRIHTNETNIIDVNPEYEQYIENYKVDNIEHNIVSKIYSVIQTNINGFITIFTKYNLFILLVIILILFIVYVIMKKKLKLYNKRGLQLIIILYTLSFGIIMPYVLLYHIVDRYIIPALIPMYLADILLIGLIGKNILSKIKKVNMKKDDKQLKLDM